MSANQSIDSNLSEQRTFDPPKSFAQNAHTKSLADYKAEHARSIENPEKYWEEVAKNFHFFKTHDKVLEWNEPFAKWFVGSKTNVAYNCLDLQIERGRGDHTAILWEAEPDEPVRRISYNELRDEVCRFANALKATGVKKGDIVTIYMPMVPELAIAMLACARIGAPHSIIFGGFSASAISDRVQDASSKFIITADGGWRRGKVVPLKATVDEAVANCPTIDKVITLKRIGDPVGWNDKHDLWWHDIVKDASTDCPAEHCDAEDLLFILYTSGTTGKPKGIMHTTAGYMIYTAHTAKHIFDLKPDDIYWCTADIGWITGHSYITYGPLQNGVTTVMYEGAPNHPDWNRFWNIVEKHKVTKFYTAPTAIRAFMKQGPQHPQSADLSSLKLLGTVGEPINPEAWMWYHKHIGRENCPIVDTFWQTETGGIMIAPQPGAIPTKPGSATMPFYGIDAAVVDEKGNEVPEGGGGYLVFKKPWPAMLRGIYGDMDRYKKQYWSDVPHCYFTSDACRIDADGYFWLMGRVDDVINISGHRLGTMEVESALVAHEAVAEAAVVAMPHDIKGQALCAFVTLKSGLNPSDSLKEALRQHVANEIGAIAKPDTIRFTESLPKTRSGKIMRRLLKELAAGNDVKGDTTTLEDFSVIANLKSDG
jgi:acetyl-CoA synthetase